MEGNAEGLSVFKSHVGTELESIVSKYPEPRLLVFPDYLKFYVIELLGHAQLAKLFDAVVSLSKLKSTDKKTTVFISSSDTSTLQSIVNAFHRVPMSFKVVLEIPRQTSILETIIAAAGFGIVKHNLPTDPKMQISVANFAADFVPLDSDYFVMPCLGTFKKYVADGDYDDLFTSSRALVKLQKIFGRIPQVVCVGKAAARVRDVMNQSAKELSDVDIPPQFSSLILFDRQCDLVSAVLSQPSVEGAIKTAFGINYGYVEAEHVPVDESDKADKKGSQKLSERLPVFATIRAMSILAANEHRGFLQSKLDEQMQFLRGEHTVTEIKNNAELMRYVSLSFGMFKSYGILMNALQRLRDVCPNRDDILTREFQLLFNKLDIVDFAENLISVSGDWKSALRLLALQSATGLGRIAWDKVQTEICSEFGLCAQTALLDFERSGLSSPDKCPIPLKLWGRRTQELFADFDSDTGKPLSPEGSALGGYIPRSVRIIQRIVEDNIKSIPDAVARALQIDITGERTAPSPDEAVKIVVFFIGGVTATEISCLRALSHDVFDGKIEFIVGATDEITGDTFMCQFFPTIYNA